MTTPQVDVELKKALATMKFDEGELAYLVLTSKPEVTLRDRFAWTLAQRGLSVCRESLRRDIVILDSNGSPAAVVEVKAMYSFNAVDEQSRGKHYLDVVSDVANAKQLSGGNPPGYALVLCAHPEKPLPNPRAPYLVRYSGLSRRVDNQQASDNLKVWLKPKGPLVRREITDTWFDLPVTVSLWLCGPI